MESTARAWGGTGVIHCIPERGQVSGGDLRVAKGARGPVFILAELLEMLRTEKDVSLVLSRNVTRA